MPTSRQIKAEHAARAAALDGLPAEVAKLRARVEALEAAAAAKPVKKAAAKKAAPPAAE
jgi:hypothetical protein